MSRITKVLLALNLLVVIALVILFSSKGIELHELFASKSSLPSTSIKPLNPPQRLSTPAPTPTLEVTELTQVNPDGSREVTVQIETITDNSKEYTIQTKDLTQPTIQQIFKETIPLDTSLTLPFNSWSPENKYIFIKKTQTSTENFLVFQASGEPFVDQPSLNVTQLFAQKYPNYAIQEVTGWASPTLLIVNTTHIETPTERGPSFWFEVPRQSFIQLSTKF